MALGLRYVAGAGEVMAKRVEAEDVKRPLVTKEPYVKPQLIEYGNVAKLTASNGTRLPVDGLGQRMTGSCL